MAALGPSALVAADPRPVHPPELRPYQHGAVAAWDGSGRRGIIVLPTGAGKTRTAIAAIATAGVPTICLAPTRVLVHQWRRALLVAGLGPIGQLADGVRDLQRVTVATVASARVHASTVGPRFALLVADEVHHHAGSDETLELFPAPLRLGLTATPPDDPVAVARLRDLVGPIVVRVSVDALAGEFLAPYDLVQVPLDLDPDESAAYRTEMAAFRTVYRAWWRTTPDRSWAAFNRVAVRSDEGRRALAAWRRARERVAWPNAKDRALAGLLATHHRSRVLVFTRDNSVAYRIAHRHLIAPLTCDIGKAERARMLERFADGSIGALVSARVLNEGLDVPDADVAILTGGSQGEREYVQRVGRVLRPRPGKRAQVVELVVRDTHEVRLHERNRSRLASG